MPKAEKGSIKDLGKRIKAKGLQKLKFYCQMCEKQCRDANGFKCHLTSESHLRQMKIFSDNAGAYMDRYSKQFEKMFLDTLRMRHSTAKTNANNVYQEVIQDKQHIHMNATIWATLSDFCKYLGKTGKCMVEETERGWYITYIERDVGKLQREENQQKRQAAEQAAEIATQQRMELQRVEAAKALDRAGGVLQSEATKLGERGEEETVQLALALETKKKKKKSAAVKLKKKSVFGEDSDDNDDEMEEEQANQPKEPPISKSEVKQPPSKPQQRSDPPSSSKRPHPESKSHIMYESKSQKRSKKMSTNNKDGGDDAEDIAWLYRGILVRIVNKKLTDYFRCKAVVDKVDGYTAEVTVMEDDGNADGDVLRLDQDDLETVSPKQVGQKVRILRGIHRGKKAVAVQLDKKKYRASLELKDGTMLEKMDYDDFSRVA